MQLQQPVIQKYIEMISRANNELVKKQLFHTLLSQLFQGNTEIASLIDQMNLGAEKTILNIPRPSRLARGRADTQYQNVIIEWEKSLAKTGEHAKAQLAEYLAGNWQSGSAYRFVLIATDGLVWRIYAPDYEKWLYLPPHENLLTPPELQLTDAFTLTATNSAEFPFFLDRYLFKTELQKPTLANIKADFGETSAVFLNAMTTLRGYLPTLANDSHWQTAYQQWEKFLTIAYGKFDNSQEIFLVHTYLSMFAKLLAYTVLTGHAEYLPKETLRKILQGEQFTSLKVERFVEEDFYAWVAVSQHFAVLQTVGRDLMQQLTEYDFTQEVQEDILKGVYQELIDLETRHALGEYYTPDWLCEKILASLPLQTDSHLLDPACGSGSFLRAAIARMRQEFPTLSATQLTQQVVGIDIHPLSVQIAKTTILLALSDLIRQEKRPVTLNVYLANSLLLPEGLAGQLFGETFKMFIDNQPYVLDMGIFESPGDFDTAISLCSDLADHTSELVSQAMFLKTLQRQLKGSRLATHVHNLYRIYQALKTAKEEGRDSIWKFILQNSYKPVFLKGRFDIVVGNPPWLTYADVTNANYQKELYELAQTYDLIPKSKANMPHLEIAAIFLAYSINYFLKANGSLAFVLPRSFLTADQHDNTRSGQTKGIELTAVWDLKEVSPWFRVPATVVFAKPSAKPSRSLPETGIAGYLVKGKLESPHCHWKSIEHAIEFTETRWFYSILSKTKTIRSALTMTFSSSQVKESYYAPLFKQGATIVPRSFYFVEIAQQLPDESDLKDRIIVVKTSEAILREAKQPWKNLTLAGRINSNFLFRTMLSKNIVPFVSINPPLVLLPILIKENQGKIIELLNQEKLFEQGELDLAKWFKQAEEMWEENKTERAKGSEMMLYNRLDFQRGLTDQNLNLRYLVLYTASAQDANAVVVDRDDLDLEFLVESKAYWFATDKLDEANYLAGFLNCSYTNQLIKEFQSRGLFGPRDVHKKILEIPFPKFDGKNDLHCQLAHLGQECAIKAKTVMGNDKDLDLNPHQLGRLRRTVRQALQEELQEIDGLVEEISKSV
jgi:type I restriction-modification system DNA methylase subunit